MQLFWKAVLNHLMPILYSERDKTQSSAHNSEAGCQKIILF